MIDSYEFGSIVISGKRYDYDVILYKDRVDSWWRETSHKVTIKDIETLVRQRPGVIIFGTGASGLMNVGKDTEDYIKGKGIEVMIMKTGEATKMFNSLSKTEDVAAALHLTC